MSPIHGRVVVERSFAGAAEAEQILRRATGGSALMRAASIKERLQWCEQFLAAVSRQTSAVADEITLQMGRPTAHAPLELIGMQERARFMMSIAEEALADENSAPLSGFRRFIRREPVGVVLSVVPWNYPYLTAVNSFLPALLAGNAVVLKHSPQTPLCGERLQAAWDETGLPEGAFQQVHCGHETALGMCRDQRVGFISFTGSVSGGRAVAKAASGRFVRIGLELGGKDAAYVREDADVAFAAENVADGAFFNAGQSCCGIERAYVHAGVYDEFVERMRAITNDYLLGDPRDKDTTLGPVVSVGAARRIQGQVDEALLSGAERVSNARVAHALGEQYVSPQLLINVTHEMALMREETFGPALGIMRVNSDEEALELINDCRYGLTASIWSRDNEASLDLGSSLDVGTVFLNRCDYLDPSLAWVGVKDSGIGCSLSKYGFDVLTRPKSFHMRLA